ncbi:MAG TPA: c-type cytochrome [Thermoanaerobaculia bacterium]|nr:c-type cytochrome [Thermoanaerobaculia bacterium]
MRARDDCGILASMSVRRATPALFFSFLLVSCAVVDLGRKQRQAPVQPDMDFASTQAVATTTSESDPAAERKYKNIQVLRGLPASQLYPVMTHMANSLGVTCAHCHTEHFQEESKIEKEVARQMIRMTRGINRSQFQGQPIVSCYTCHRGAQYPSPAPLIEQAGWQRLVRPPAARKPLPELESVVSRYEKALAAKASPEPLTRSGELMLVGGLDEKLTDRFELTTGPDGSLRLRTALAVPPAVEDAMRRYGLGRIDLKETYQNMSVIRGVEVEGREAYVIAADAGGPPERLAFDAETGMLLRAEFGTVTELGWVPEQISFSDYKMVGGELVPQTVRWARGDFLVAMRFAN